MDPETQRKMQAVMLGGASSRYVLDPDALARAAGAPLGPVLVELLRLACRLEPFRPWTAFDALEINLTLLGGGEIDNRHSGKPEGLLPFLETNVDLAYAGFFDEGRSLPLDQRPICFVCEGEARIVAANLADFLSLAAIAGAMAIQADPPSDESWMAFRNERLEAIEPARRLFEEASAHLCSLPGVQIPKRPSKLARARADLIVVPSAADADVEGA